MCIGHFKHHYVGCITSCIALRNYILEMGPPMSKKQVKESQSRAAPPLFAQARVGA